MGMNSELKDAAARLERARRRAQSKAQIARDAGNHQLARFHDGRESALNTAISCLLHPRNVKAAMELIMGPSRNPRYAGPKTLVVKVENECGDVLDEVDLSDMGEGVSACSNLAEEAYDMVITWHTNYIGDKQ